LTKCTKKYIISLWFIEIITFREGRSATVIRTVLIVDDEFLLNVVRAVTTVYRPDAVIVIAKQKDYAPEIINATGRRLDRSIAELGLVLDSVDLVDIIQRRHPEARVISMTGRKRATKKRIYSVKELATKRKELLKTIREIMEK
jgi:hypothetical protein